MRLVLAAGLFFASAIPRGSGCASAEWATPRVEVEPSRVMPEAAGGRVVQAWSARPTTPDEVRATIGREMSAQMPPLNDCYQARLRAVPDLEGQWRLKFTVLPSGGVGDVAVVALERTDRELADCMAEQVRAWTFSPLPGRQPVQRTIRFRP